MARLPPEVREACKGGSETRKGLIFSQALGEAPSAEKFSRPLRDARFSAEHSGIKAAGGSGQRLWRSNRDDGRRFVASMFRFRERMVSAR